MNIKNKEILNKDNDKIYKEEIKSSFCCQFLEDIVNEEEADYRFVYNPMMREYYIKSNLPPYIRMLRFCPWCRTGFPKSVRDELFNILEKEYGIDPFISEQRGNIPAKFLTEEWWKERGL